MNLLNPSQEEISKNFAKWNEVIDYQTRTIKTWTTLNELAWIAEAASRATNWLELGSYCGRSAKVALLANPDLKITCLDTWDDHDCLPTFKHHLRCEIADGRVRFIQGRTQDTILELGDSFDGCFIDAGHTTPECRKDIENVIPLMMAGSIVAGHDWYGDNDVAEGVKQAIHGKIWNPCDSIWANQL